MHKIKGYFKQFRGGFESWVRATWQWWQQYANLTTMAAIGQLNDGGDYKKGLGLGLGIWERD